MRAASQSSIDDGDPTTPLGELYSSKSLVKLDLLERAGDIIGRTCFASGEERDARSDAVKLSTDAVQAADANEPATRTALVATAEPTTAPSRTASLDAVRKRLPLPTESGADPPNGNASMNASRVLEVPRINFLVDIC